MDILEAVKPEDAKALLEKHWDNFINDGDWKWMSGHGINSVRIPILYVHFLAGSPKYKSLLKGTDYEKYGMVYEGAWERVTRGIEKAAALNIGVLIDLHGVPGGQNTDSHSGKSDGKVNLWHGLRSSSNQKLTIEILVALAEALAPFENMIGLELMNEPQNSSSLKAFYSDAIKQIRKSKVPEAANLPLYLGDAWDTNHYSNFVGHHTDFNNTLVLDHHLYRCFTPRDHKTSAQEHACNIDVNTQGKTAWWLKNMSDNAKGSIIIGEWSGALNPGSFHNCGSKLEARKAWSFAQWRAFETYTAGYYYWTLKKEGGPDPGWCLYTAMEKGSMPPSLNILDGGHVDIGALESQGDQLAERCFKEHAKYWDSKGEQFEHDQYKHGFETGWRDALDFLKDGSEVGLGYQLMKLRLASYKQDHNSKYVWEFEHGFMQAVDAFRRTLYA